MSYLERKRDMIMSVKNTVRGYLRTTSGEPPLALTDCYPDKLKIKLYGKSTQASGTYYTANHTITATECNYSTRKLWFPPSSSGYVGDFYVYDGFAYWCFTLNYDCDTSSSEYYIDCLREGIYEVDYNNIETQRVTVTQSSAAPSGYTDFSSYITSRSGNVYLFGGTPCSFGAVNGKYANFTPLVSLISGTVLEYDSYAQTLKYKRDKIYITLSESLGAGTYYLIYDGKFYRFTSAVGLYNEDSFFLDTVNCAFYEDGEVPALIANADLLSSTPTGATQLTVDHATSSYDSITFTEGTTATGTILTAENVTAKTYPDTVHPQTITSPTAGGTVRGFNLWDEQWEMGIYEGTTGAPYIYPNRIRSKYNSPIPCLPSALYYTKNPLGSMIICFFDSHDTFISNKGANNRTFTTPSNAAYMRFYIGGVNLTSYNHDICINISDPALNGTYEPYQAPTDIVVTDTNGQPVKLYGLPVTSDGNVTIGSQQYLSDVLADNGDGTATIERNTGHIASYDGETITADYLSTTGGLDTGAEIVYLLSESTTEPVTITKNKAMQGTTIIESDCPYVGAEYYSWEREVE